MQTVLRTTKRLVLRKFERADLPAHRHALPVYLPGTGAAEKPAGHLPPLPAESGRQEERVYQKYWNASAVHFVEAGL